MNGQTEDSKPRIFILMDNLNQLLALSEFLSYEYIVLTASNEEEGFTMLSQYKKGIDVLITDLKTLRKTGLNLLTRIRQQYISLQVIVIKHVGSLQLSEEVEDRSVIAYIEEPFDHEQLTALIEQVLRQKELSDFTGETQSLELIALLQLYCISEAKVTLRVVRETAKGKQQGNIYFEGGRVTNALYGKKRGEEAFYDIVGWESGRYVTRYAVVAKHKDISRPWEQLLIEALRRDAERSVEKEPEETKSNIIPSPETDTAIGDTQAADQKKETRLPPQIMSLLQNILEELQTESDDLDNAVITDSSGNMVSAVKSESAQTMTAGICELITKTIQFSERVDGELDLGPFDEAVILSETRLMLLYPIENLGVLGVTTAKENQGMIRWNCREALEKIEEILST